MAGVSSPRPDKILNYPQKGELTFLFRKKLGRNDFKVGLVLTVVSTDYLRSLPRPLLDVITREGLTVRCYTPALHHGLVLKTHRDVPGFRFKRSGWDQIASANRFLVGQYVDCWALYDAEDGPRGSLSFLIEPAGDCAVPDEAASGGAETSSGS